MLDRVLSSIAVVISIGACLLFWMNRSPKIGYAETQILLSEFSEAVQARKQFEDAQKEWDKNLKQINDSLVASMNRMKAGYDKASAKERGEMSSALEQRNADLQRYTQAVKKMSVEKEKELMDPVVRKMNTYLDSWGKQNGYDLILGALAAGSILQANSDLNVTSRIVHDINLFYRDLPVSPDSSGGKSGSSPKTDSSAGAKGK